MADNNNNNNANPSDEEKQTQDIKKTIFPRKLFRVKNISGILSVVSFVISLPILASVTWLLYMKSYDCESLFKLPRLQIGISIGLIFVFLVCNAALFLRTRFPMVGIIVVMVPLTVMFTIGLALVGANNMESRSIPATPLWFKSKIHDNNLWSNIKDCIYDTGVCQDLVIATIQLKSYDFNMKRLSSIEYGCCRPPTDCHMQYVNATFWEKGVDHDQLAAVNDGFHSKNGDCDAWNNERGVLCYNCQTCREGYIRTLQRKWFKLGVFLVCMALILFTSHLFLFLATMWELHLSLEQN